MKQLPTLAELHADPATAFKNDQLRTLLNFPPPVEWLKTHPTATTKNDQGQTVKSVYMPIDKVEHLLDCIFQIWNVEVKQTQLILNSLVVTVRLHYKDPVLNEWRYHDGIGAKSIQLDAGSKPSQMENLKSDAIQMAAPSAKSYAIKDAADHLGAIFGRDLNRRNTIEFSGKYTPNETTPPPANKLQQPLNL